VSKPHDTLYHRVYGVYVSVPYITLSQQPRVFHPPLLVGAFRHNVVNYLKVVSKACSKLVLK
jgi:hypothetical protein